MADVIFDAMVEAQANGVLPEWGARVIARAFANEFVGEPGALHQFAVTGKADRKQLLRELVQLDGEIPEHHDMHALVNLLGRYFMPQRQSSDHEQTIESAWPIRELGERLNRALSEHGDTFQAYLCLPGVEVDDPELLANFHNAYIGSYHSMRELVDELTDARASLAAAQAAAEQFDFGAFVTLDYRAIAMLARETWDVVFLDGRLYVFSK